MASFFYLHILGLSIEMGGNFKLVLKVVSLHLFRRIDFSCFIHKNVLKVTSGSSAAASPAAV